MGLDLIKSFELSKELTQKIFNLDIAVEVLVFQNSTVYLEVFNMPRDHERSCVHIDLMVEDIAEFINICDQHAIHHYSVQKGEKTLRFVKDYSENIFEIKQRT